ncbi:hypothetical protein QBC34DRAFT_436261 [Podospora aff. communis PSN243]|uniref:Amidoligase enzyme n=1 Tax=Podospora aff. communis PSN243 TaxID=3040156 RepID=A0AAV9GU81_9PEZI|nr:hypothetical protein QBC34DRAFT_436261 [Podospora aff. communis PSN243]
MAQWIPEQDAMETGNCLSFAVELEFIMSFKEEEYHLNAVPEIPVFTPEYEATQPEALVRKQTDCYREDPNKFPNLEMREFFQGRGFGLLNEIASHNTPKRFPEMYLFPHTGWDIDEDCSVRELVATGYDAERMFPQYHYIGLEIKTPVLRHSQASFDHIREVMAAINEKFRVRTNLTCGMHCHVGAGTKMMRNNEGTYLVDSALKQPVFKARTFSLQDLRRISALVWAADPFLATLHPPERQRNQWSPSIRLESKLAEGRCGKPANKFSTPGPETELDKEPTKPMQRISSERFPATRPKTLPADAEERSKVLEDQPRPRKVVLDRVFPGADMLLAATSKMQIADMLSVQDSVSRMNYNFAQYGAGNSCLNSTTFDKGTIEFREAAGSMNPEAATNWAAVGCNLVHFARTAEIQTFHRVLNRLARAEEAALNGTGNQYDIISFLGDIGLPSIALWYEKRLRRAPMTHWYPMQIQFPVELPEVLVNPKTLWTREVEKRPSTKASQSSRKADAKRCRRRRLEGNMKARPATRKVAATTPKVSRQSPPPAGNETVNRNDWCNQWLNQGVGSASSAGHEAHPSPPASAVVSSPAATRPAVEQPQPTREERAEADRSESRQQDEPHVGFIKKGMKNLRLGTSK